MREIADWAREVGALVFVDAVHYAPHALIDVNQMGCDALVCSARIPSAQPTNHFTRQKAPGTPQERYISQATERLHFHGKWTKSLTWPMFSTKKRCSLCDLC